MLRRLLAAATAILLLASGAAFAAGSAEAAKKQTFRLMVYDVPACSNCTAPFTRSQGEKLVVYGFVGPSKSRPYTVQARSGSKWHVIKKKRMHNGSSGFHVTHSRIGHYTIRAVAPRYQGQRRVVSRTISWTVLLKTSVSGAFSANPAPANSEIVVTGRFTPARARYVSVQTVDSRVGGNIGWSVMSNPDGTFAISLPTGGAGTYNFRMTLEQTSTEGPVSVWLPRLHVG